MLNELACLGDNFLNTGDVKSIYLGELKINLSVFPNEWLPKGDMVSDIVLKKPPRCDEQILKGKCFENLELQNM